MPISPQRRQDIIWELRAAAGYFDRLAAEIENDPQSHPDAPEQQTAKLIYQGVLLLQWRFESQGDEARKSLPQEAMLHQTQDHLDAWQIKVDHEYGEDNAQK